MTRHTKASIGLVHICLTSGFELEAEVDMGVFRNRETYPSGPRRVCLILLHVGVADQDKEKRVWGRREEWADPAKNT